MNYGTLEVVDQPIFDTAYTLAPRHRGMTEREKMFVTPIGQMVMTNKGGRVKQWADTNMLMPGQLDMPKSMEVLAVRCALIGRRIFPCDSRYYRDTYLEFRIGMKTKWSGPAWMCADPAAMFGSADALARLDAQDRADVVRSLRRELDPAPVIHVCEPFDVVITYGEAWFDAWYNAPDRIVVLLEGKLSVATI